MTPFQFLGSSGGFFIVFISFFDENIFRMAPGGTARFAASHVELFCLPMSQDTMLIWVKEQTVLGIIYTPDHEKA